MDREFLKDLLETCSVSGREEAIQRKALTFGRQFAQQQLTDPSGNAVSVVNPQAERKVLLCGHIDEVGFIVTHIDGSGNVHIAKAGGVRPKLYVGSPMQIWHGDQMVSGVMAVTKSLLKQAEVGPEDLVIDIGANSKEDALQVVSLGDPVCADVRVRELLNDRFTCRALDNRTGAFVILEAAKRAAELGASAGIYAATTVGEETSMRGAYYAGARIKPTCALAVDVTWASDCPGTDPATTGEVKVGGGPVICMGSAVNKKMNRLLGQVAAEQGIEIQWELAGGRTGTDGDVVNTTGEGVPMALVSIPLRYMHSSVEVGSWKDLENCIELIARFILALEKELAQGFDFCPISPN